MASLHLMGYKSKLQVIRRGGQNRQYYLICPAPLAAALELEKGEALEWIIKDRHTFELPGEQLGPALVNEPVPRVQLRREAVVVLARLTHRFFD